MPQILAPDTVKHHIPKVKFSLYLTKHYAMKTYGEVDV
jgi:hypothetical protein